MNTRDWEWTSHDGLKMYAQSWEPEEKHKAVVCLVHVLGEHSGRYALEGKALAEACFAFAGFDLRGHIPSFETYMDDIEGLVIR